MSDPTGAEVKIIPAILPKSFSDIEEHLKKIRGAASLAQIDIVDGRYANNRTWPYKDHDTFETLIKEEVKLGVWQEFNYQFDLMVEKPLEHMSEFVRAGPSQIILHEKSQNPLETLEKLIQIRSEDTDLEHLTIGVAIDSDSQPDVLEPFEAQYDFVQVMGISKVGFQGQAFDKRALYLVERLRRRYRDIVLQVDGGVSLDTANALAKAGANMLIAGSAIFKADDPKAAIEQLKAEANRI